MPHQADTQNRYCPNCYTPLSLQDTYCGNCGQKYTDGKVTVGQLIRDFFDSVFNLDARIVHTIRDLFIPGKLTVAYFEGKHRRYVAPVRLFFILAIVHFAVLSTFELNELEKQITQWNASYLQKAHLANFRDQLDTARVAVENEFPTADRLQEALDSLEKKLPDARQDSFGIGVIDLDADSGLTTKTTKFSMHELMEVPVDSLVRKSNIEHFWGRLSMRQMIRLTREGGSFTRYALGKLIWMVVLMMPALALLLKLIYIRRENYYVEHLVFSFHYHAFSFLVFSVALLLGEWPWLSGYIGADALGALAFLWVFYYLYKSMRRYYRQNRIKTLLKFMIINFSYLIIFILFLTLTFIVTALMY
jgi:hypothetical protein